MQMRSVCRLPKTGERNDPGALRHGPIPTIFGGRSVAHTHYREGRAPKTQRDNTQPKSSTRPCIRNLPGLSKATRTATPPASSPVFLLLPSCIAPIVVVAVVPLRAPRPTIPATLARENERQEPVAGARQAAHSMQVRLLCCQQTDRLISSLWIRSDHSPPPGVEHDMTWQTYHGRPLHHKRVVFHVVLSHDGGFGRTVVCVGGLCSRDGVTHTHTLRSYLSRSLK